MGGGRGGGGGGGGEVLIIYFNLLSNFYFLHYLVQEIDHSLIHNSLLIGVIVLLDVFVNDAGFELLTIWPEKAIESSSEMEELENVSPLEAEKWLISPCLSEML